MQTEALFWAGKAKFDSRIGVVLRGKEGGKIKKRVERQSLGPTMRKEDEKTKGGLGVAGVGGKDGRRRCLRASCG